MSRKDVRDVGGPGKEGSGRVGVYAMTGITHAYTLECNYNMGRRVGRVAHPHVPSELERADGLQHRSLSPQPPLRCLSPKYTPESWRAVGKALAISALDATSANPCSRLGAPGSEMAVGLARLRSTATAWVRAAERAAREKAAAKAAAGGGGDGGSDAGGSDAGGSDGGSDGEGEAAGARPPKDRRKVENVPPANSNEQGKGNAAAAATSQLASAVAPYWVAVRGTPLTRRGFSLKTPPVGRLPPGAYVRVLETKAMLDGTLRAAVALPGAGDAAYGWMTLVMGSSGVENAAYLAPQPAPGEEPAGCATQAEPMAQGQAAGGAFFVF